jgi:aspartate kinase
MALIVQKYGGTSLGSPDRIRASAARIAAARRNGDDVVVVVSAMGHTTDELIALAQQVSPAATTHRREMDMLLTAGERISMALTAMALRDLATDCVSFTGSQAGIITDESHSNARILEIRPTRIEEELARHRVVIVAGFQGVSRTKEITTLGRGGSDTTAVHLATALHAARCEILTDVRGVFSADPRLVPTAQPYAELPLAAVLQMARNGAQVMHDRAMEHALEHGMTLWVGHSQDAAAGTWLRPQVEGALPPILAVTLSPGAVVAIARDSEAAQATHQKLSSQPVSPGGAPGATHVSVSSGGGSAHLTVAGSTITIPITGDENACRAALNLWHHNLISPLTRTGGQSS